MSSATQTTSPPPEPLSMRAVLAIPTMRRMWYAQIVSVLGDFLALFAVIGVMTFKLGATPRQVTGVQIAYVLPIALLGIVAGVFVDRWQPKRTMVASDLLRAGLCLLLLAVHSVWGYYLVLAAISVVSSFFSPAQGVTIRNIVPMHGLRAANSALQQVMFLMRIVGPAAAAALVASLGARSCYLFDAASFVASGLLLLSAAIPAVARQQESAAEAAASERKGIARIFGDMRQGAGFILHHAAVLFVILALAAGMFVMGCFGPLIAVYVRDILHASTKTFGFVSPMVGVGLLVGITLLNGPGKKLPNNLLVYAGLGGIAFGVALMAGFTLLATTVLGCFFVGFFAGGIIVPSQVLIQQEVPMELMGRVGSTVMSVVFTAQIGGLLLSGALTQLISVRWVFTICSVMLVVLAAAGKLFMEPKAVASTH